MQAQQGQFSWHQHSYCLSYHVLCVHVLAGMHAFMGVHACEMHVRTRHTRDGCPLPEINEVQPPVSHPVPNPPRPVQEANLYNTATQLSNHTHAQSHKTIHLKALSLIQLQAGRDPRES